MKSAIQRVALLCAIGCGGGSAPEPAPPQTTAAQPAAAADTPEARCDAGDMAACAELGDAYFWGGSVEKNLPLAVKYSQRACDGDNARGCKQLAYYYAMGQGVPVDRSKQMQFEQKWIALLDRACNGNDADACFELADHFNSSINYIMEQGQMISMQPESYEDPDKAVAELEALQTENTRRANEYIRAACKLEHEKACKWYRTGETDRDVWYYVDGEGPTQ